MKLDITDIKTKEVLSWEGIHLLHFKGSACSQKLRIFLNIKNIDWNIPDPKFLEEEQFDEIRDMIKSKIISELLV